jgi:uncharacterized small protein (DUF1192 family)
MKIPRFSELDLARLAALPSGPRLERALLLYSTGGGSWSYNPVRASTSDILAAKTPLTGDLGQLPWSNILSQIKAACTRGTPQIDANVEVGKVLFDESRERSWLAAKYEMGRLPIGVGEFVQYWSNVVVEDESGIFIPYFDHRRANGVANADIRRVIFSMQHIWLRDRHPDLAGARLAIIRFPQIRDGRAMQVTFHTEAELLSYEELNERIRTIYATWAQILAERNRRSTGTSGPTPFGF